MPRLAGQWLPLLFVGISLLGGCASSSRHLTVASLSDQLVDNLERRVTTSSAMVLILKIHESPGAREEEEPLRSSRGDTAPDGDTTEDPHHVDPVGAELEHAFTVELSRRLNVLDAEHAKVPRLDAGQGDVWDLALELGATHVLVGDYVTKQDGLLVSVRLVDPESLLIVAAVRGKVSAADLGTLDDGG